MEWVKASERLPESQEWIPIKVDGKNDLGYYRMFIGDKFGSLNHGSLINKIRVEWLDESESLPSEKKYTEEDVAKIKKESFDEGFKTCWDGLDSKPLDKTIEL